MESFLEHDRQCSTVDQDRMCQTCGYEWNDEAGKLHSCLQEGRLRKLEWQLEQLKANREMLTKKFEALTEACNSFVNNMTQFFK